MQRIQALTLLSECTGDDIWSVEHCRLRRLPEAWIVELADCFESGFQSDSQTIYLEDRVINQYQGIRDVDLAMRLGEHLGIDVGGLEQRAVSRSHLVKLIAEAAEEDL
ncbi:MAG TPA: hypothetical protein DDW52_16370 [Planctomycetaceae bacterium]|nr:hypothetical protein [Planctomycetaceae bacterium]